MLIRLRRGKYWLICSKCGVAKTVERIAHKNTSDTTLRSLAIRDFLQEEWFGILIPDSLCPECVKNAIRGDFRG